MDTIKCSIAQRANNKGESPKDMIIFLLLKIEL